MARLTVYSRNVKIVPRERLEIESALAPAAVLAAIPRAVAETNRGTFLLGTSAVTTVRPSWMTTSPSNAIPSVPSASDAPGGRGAGWRASQVLPQFPRGGYQEPCL
jgi:hypothetical protein